MTRFKQRKYNRAHKNANYHTRAGNPDKYNPAEGVSGYRKFWDSNKGTYVRPRVLDGSEAK